MATELINKDNTFSSKREIYSISEYRKCLVMFSKSFDTQSKLETQSPIFVDTNILLRYYSISFTARKKLFDFIKKHKNRIVITTQVQLEFIKNREDIIQRFFEQVTNKIPKDFNSDIVNKMKSFLDQHKIVLKDYPFVESGISKSQKELETLLKKLNETAEQKRKDYNNLIVNDDFLDLLSSCILYKGLTTTEKELVIKDFDSLKKDIPIENVDSFLNRANRVFPGLGDIKEKPDDPYGDYIIFHEMLKYCLEESKDITFLTFDNSKGDWFTKSKSPHLHYVYNAFCNTGHLIYIIDAERVLGETLNIDIESLLRENQISLLTPITISSLNEFIQKSDLYFGIEKGSFSSFHIDELKLNGYNFIEEVERDLTRAKFAIEEYMHTNSDLNTVGFTRVGLRIANPKCDKIIGRDGVTTLVSENLKTNYEKVRHLVR